MATTTTKNKATESKTDKASESNVNKTTTKSKSTQDTKPILHPLKDLKSHPIDGTVILNKYYQRNCALWIPVFFAILSVALGVYIKLAPGTERAWYINIGLWVVLALLIILFITTLINLCRFTKFWEIKISNEAPALRLLECYQIVEQRGDIFTVIRRTDMMSLLDKIKENYIKPKHNNVIYDDENVKKVKNNRTHGASTPEYHGISMPKIKPAKPEPNEKTSKKSHKPSIFKTPDEVVSKLDKLENSLSELEKQANSLEPLPQVNMDDDYVIPVSTRNIASMAQEEIFKETFEPKH